MGSIAEPNQPTFYKYNPQGKMVKVSQGVQNRYFLYDFLGRLIRVRQPEQEVNPALDLVDLVSGNNQWTAAMEYDLVGNLIKTTDAENKQITNTYDKVGRVKVRSYSNLDTPSVYYYYDGMGLSTPPPATNNFAKGKLTKVSSSISATQFTSFDNFGRTLASQQITDGNTYESKYKYNFSGALLEETYPSGKIVRNFYKSDGGLTKIVRNGKAFASDFSYTATGRIERFKLGNGLWESGKINSRQQVEEINLGISPSDGSKWQVKYEYGEIDSNGNTNFAKNAGNISKQTINFAGLAQPFVQIYKYDALQRIIEAKENNGSVTGTQNWKQTFNYDRFGNRNQFSQIVGSTALVINNQTLPSVDANTNRFNSGQNYQYDKAGNIIQDVVNGQVRNFIFNGDNKQVHVKDGNNVPIGTYYYDGNGLRVKKVTATETTIFVYDGGKKLVAEYSTQQNSNPTISYTTTDTLGSPRVITDKQGNVISRRDFLPFGEELNANIATNRLESQKYNFGIDNIRKRFTGYEKDLETGLDFAEARYYNNLHGRFTAVDPLLASGQSADPQTFNRFVYVGNSPLMRVDPKGLVWGVSGHKVRWFKNTKQLQASGYDKFVPTNWTYQGEGNLTVVLNPRKNQFTIISNAIPLDKGERAHKDEGLPSGSQEFIDSFAKNAEKQGKIVIVGTGAAIVLGTGVGVYAGVYGSFVASGLTALELGGVGTAEYVATHPGQTAKVIEGVGTTLSKATSTSRPLQSSDFGLAEGAIKSIKGTLEVVNGVATAKVDYIEGELGRSGLRAFTNFIDTARQTGASSLRIETTLANDDLLNALTKVLAQRYDAVIQTVGKPGGYQNIIVINFR